ncbi:uncharacterized protein B0H18DRAFT_1145524 [Fomitopsis serialis]|uniref:uncharacterized protein n=1 Tax=Fomitopsis serialis TaxID=139415 RepID=UPI0020078F2E|nr:uncharacterized protein B0H18DRAFT_1145524 [Neoantrodia serialis]KAH9914278.1 hypothetical protein B0H18DRAFT_1145524 [Neoantrodia serialis]
MSWSTLAPNGVFYQNPDANLWRDPDAPCSWVVHWPATCQDGGSSDQDMHLRPANVTAAMPHQPIGTDDIDIQAVEHGASGAAGAPDNIVWNDEEIIETSTAVDEAESMVGGTLRGATDPLAWQDDEIFETSTTIEEAEHIIGGTIRRAYGSRMPSAHQRTDSGSTQSSATLASIPDASVRVRTWAEVVRATPRNQTGGRK